MEVTTKSLAKLDREDWGLIDAIDDINKCINHVRGAESTYNDALDCFPIPSDPKVMGRINDYQVTSATIMDIICAMLCRTSGDLSEYVRKICTKEKTL